VLLGEERVGEVGPDILGRNAAVVADLLDGAHERPPLAVGVGAESPGLLHVGLAAEELRCRERLAVGGELLLDGLAGGAGEPSPPSWLVASAGDFGGCGPASAGLVVVDGAVALAGHA